MLVGVLKGALLFVADLARAILDVPVEVDFISISRFAPDSGRVKILHDLGTDIGGRDVVLVEDIVDTGLTLAYLTEPARDARTAVARRRARCSTARVAGSCPRTSRYRGVELVDEFVLGYGLHVRDLYRNLPFVVAGDRADVAAAPDCYVARAVPGAGGVRREPGGSGDRRVG